MGKLFEYRDDTLYCHHSLDPAPNPDQFYIHAHETPEIYCFLAGEGRFLVEGTSYPLSPGDILLMRPAETHKLLISQEHPYERIAVHFSDSLFHSLDPDRSLLRPFYRRPLGIGNRYPAEAVSSLSGLLRDLEPERLKILARLMLFLAELREPGIDSSTETGSAGFSRELVDYVNDRLFEPLSLKEIGTVFSRSPSQISRVFRRATGTSLWEYVMIKRLLAARAMIQRGDTAVHAMTECGFSDYSSFYRAYRQRFGHSPGQDRNTAT